MVFQTIQEAFPNNRRMGRFMLDKSIVENYKLALQFLKGMVILQSVYNLETGAMEYTAINNELFRKMRDNDTLVPFYRPSLKNGKLIMEEYK